MTVTPLSSIPSGYGKNLSTEENLERAMEYKKRLAKNVRMQKIRKLTGRAFISLLIPFFISVLITFIITFAVNGASHPNSAVFFKNFLYCFSKTFFLSLPLMMWYIFNK